MKGLPIGAENLSAWRSRATLRAAQWGMGTVEVNFVSGHRAASGENGEKGFFGLFLFMAGVIIAFCVLTGVTQNGANN